MQNKSLNNLNLHTTDQIDRITSQYNQRNFFAIPQSISELLFGLIDLNKNQSCLVLNSNFGEVSNHLAAIPYVTYFEEDTEKISIAKALNPNLEIHSSKISEYSFSQKYDLLIALPEDRKIGTISNSSFYSNLHNVSLHFLNESCSLILFVPENFLSARIYSNQRNFILKNFGLDKIIKIPRNVLSHTGRTHYILVINKDQIKSTQFFLEPTNNLVEQESNFSIPHKNLFERWDPNYHNPKNHKYLKHLIGHDLKKIEDLVEVINGTAFFPHERKDTGQLRIITARNIRSGNIQESQSDTFVELQNINKRQKNTILQKGDILIPRFHRNPFKVYCHNENNSMLIASHDVFILRGKNASYVSTYLNTKNGSELFEKQLNRHSIGELNRIISRDDLLKFQIPILPISNLELASKNNLENLSFQELLEIKIKYDELKSKYSKLKSKVNTTPYDQLLKALTTPLNEILKIQKENTEQIESIASKVDDVKAFMQNLTFDFIEIKQLPRTIEEKVERLNKQLEDRINNIAIEHKQLEEYINEIRKWFDYFDILEIKSQKYLPEAEYIFDHISKLENADYSPFILQYCRALENELLSKIFRAFVQSTVDRGIILEEAYAWDNGKKESGKPNDENTFKLFKQIQKCHTKTSNEWYFELGTMEFSLRYLTGRTIEKSPLLKDLKAFVLERFEKELLNIEYLDEIRSIIRDYRNQSAHPNLINTNQAILFHQRMKDCLVNLLEKYKR